MGGGKRGNCPLGENFCMGAENYEGGNFPLLEIFQRRP